MKEWNINQSESLYNLKGWGNDYFSVNAKGNLDVKLGQSEVKADLLEIIQDEELHEIATPLLFRFPELIEDRIIKIQESFQKAKKEFNYQAESYSVYPIKVNQMKPIVEEIASLGSKFNVGLEAGSKPELHAVLAFANDTAPIICNGYKDEDFVELALLAQKMGKNIYLVVEKPNELDLIIKTAKKYKIRPNIGIRIKLSSPGSGKWEDSGGDKSKFGLRASELIDAVNTAKKHKLLDKVKLIHFHLGSQITKIRNIKNALREAAQYYYELRNLGCDIEYFDVGGGLGVDYDGTQSSNASSMNYEIQEYANDIVAAVVNISDKFNLPHPKIITESGRAISAYHSVLVFDVLEKVSLPKISNNFKINESDEENLKELFEIYKNINKKNKFEKFHDAGQIREECHTLFSLGHMNLENRAKADKIYWSIIRKFKNLASKADMATEEYNIVSKLLLEKYFCNFSLFQSLPDSWAIDQLFPVMPISKLNIKPEIDATLHDVTCDSDGKIDRFVGENGKQLNLKVHSFNPKEKYYIGVFLVGAYQEILGDLHNLFGDTNTIHVRSKGDTWNIENVIDGESVNEVLSYVGFNSKDLVKKMENWVKQSQKAGKINSDEGREYLAIYRSGLYGYTYLE